MTPALADEQPLEHVRAAIQVVYDWGLFSECIAGHFRERIAADFGAERAR